MLFIGGVEIQSFTPGNIAAQFASRRPNWLLLANCAFTFDPNSLSLLAVCHRRPICFVYVLRSGQPVLRSAVSVTYPSDHSASCWFLHSVFESRLPQLNYPAVSKAVCVDLLDAVGVINGAPSHSQSQKEKAAPNTATARPTQRGVPDADRRV